MAFGTTELDAEQEAKLQARIAKFVGERKLEVPAIFLLEMAKPLSFLASQAMVLSSAVLVPMLGLHNSEELHWLLADRARVERLIQRLEVPEPVKHENDKSQPGIVDGPNA